jgi:hypothetical protein
MHKNKIQMKMKNFKYYKLITVLVTLLLLNCSEQKEPVVSNLSSIIDNNAIINISTNHLEYINNGEITELVRNDFSMENNDIANLMSKLNLEQRNIDYLVLYIDKKYELTTKEQLVLTDIKGISLYTKKEDTYFHDFLVQNNKEWKIFEKFSNKKVDKLQFSLQNLLSNNLGTIKTLCQIGKISNEFAKVQKSQIVSLYKSANKNSLEKELLDDALIIPNVPDMDCFTCPGDDKNSCSRLLLTCKYTCSTNQMSEIADYLGEERVPKEILYDFRDNFLNKYPKGKKYIDSYYKITTAFDLLNVITLENYATDRPFLDKVISVCNKLQYGHDNDIIITPEFEQEILGRINNWSTLTTNSEFQNILTNFKTDLVNKAFAKELKKVRNKTRADIIKILKEE